MFPMMPFKIAITIQPFLFFLPSSSCIAIDKKEQLVEKNKLGNKVGGLQHLFQLRSRWWWWYRRLQFVKVLIEGWDSFFKTLAFARISHDDARPRSGFEGISGQNLPMVKDALRESLSTSVAAQIGGKTFKQTNNALVSTKNGVVIEIAYRRTRLRASKP